MSQTDTSLDPGKKIKDFVEGFNVAVVNSHDDLEAVVDRFHTLDMIQVADAHAMNREKLLAHVRAVRRTRPDIRVEILEAMGEDDRVAVRYLMHVNRTLRSGPESLTVEVCEFVEFDTDGRLRRAHALTRNRDVSKDSEAMMHPQRTTSPSATRTYRVLGMTCEHCERTVSDEVARIDGVDSARANSEAGTVIVSSRNIVDNTRLRSAVEQAGYEFAGPTVGQAEEFL